MTNFSEAYILAYIKKDLPGDALRECDALMQSSPRFRKKVNQIRAICDLSVTLRSQKEIDTEKAWVRLSRKIAFVSFQTKIWNITRTAAAILLPLFLLHQYVVQPMLKTTPAEMITLVSAPGIVTKAVLPDGSEVWLNAQSELTYPARFTGKERTVSVSGEAYFKVVADKKNRFNVVMPDGIAVSAFGTEFNVHAYQDEPDYQVTLARGNIEVASANFIKKEILTAGQKVVLSPTMGSMTVLQADTYMETAWKDGKMVFRREKLETISQKLSRKFGVVIQLEGDALKDYEYTATFTDEMLEDILDLLMRSAPITYSISKQEQLDNAMFTRRVVTIKSKK
jgi:Fe2+-dicitrate sensor, membrane component